MTFIAQTIKYLALAIILLLIAQNWEKMVIGLDFLNYHVDTISFVAVLLAGFLAGAAWGMINPLLQLWALKRRLKDRGQGEA